MTAKSERDELAGRLGQQLRASRKQQGLTQARLARRAGISVRYLGDIERGRRLPAITMLAKITAQLRISLDQILTLPALRPTPDDPELEQAIERLSSASPQTIKLIADMLESISRHGLPELKIRASKRRR